ncbi:hypothetical protein Goklo_015985 [Gossypium klotzschianum]|uniref:Aminotransferase-like plant mobile domain-containing protein n=1 Tax=Gossypium klotzschianum TaxID=34286 RepID=A0A7J8UCQ9_9ROSI|nr:hypothetical protein [Gossypium klotzschianum]
MMKVVRIYVKIEKSWVKTQQELEEDRLTFIYGMGESQGGVLVMGRLLVVISPLFLVGWNEYRFVQVTRSTIELKWLEDNFKDLDGSLSPLKREQYARMYILRLIGGVLMADKSQTFVYLRLLLQLVDLKKEGGLSWGSTMLTMFYVGLPEELEDIRLLLDQQSETDFLVNPNIWHMKVPLIVFATMEMHKSDRLMRQFGFRQTFLSSPQDIRALHKVDLRGRTDED